MNDFPILFGSDEHAEHESKRLLDDLKTTGLKIPSIRPKVQTVMRMVLPHDGKFMLQVHGVDHPPFVAEGEAGDVAELIHDERTGDTQILINGLVPGRKWPELPPLERPCEGTIIDCSIRGEVRRFGDVTIYDYFADVEVVWAGPIGEIRVDDQRLADMGVPWSVGQTIDNFTRLTITELPLEDFGNRVPPIVAEAALSRPHVTSSDPAVDKALEDALDSIPGQSSKDRVGNAEQLQHEPPEEPDRRGESIERAWGHDKWTPDHD